MRKSFKDILKTLQHHFKNTQVITSRDKLAELTGYTKPTVSQALSEFYSLGLITMRYTDADNKKVNFSLEFTDKVRSDDPEVPKDSLKSSPLKRTSTFSTVLRYFGVGYVVVFDGDNWFIPQKVVREMIYMYADVNEDGSTMMSQLIEKRKIVEQAGGYVYNASQLRAKGISVSPTGRLTGATTPSNNSLFLRLDWLRAFFGGKENKTLLQVLDTFVEPLRDADSLVGFGKVPEASNIPQKQEVVTAKLPSGYSLLGRLKKLEEENASLKEENSKLKGDRQEKMTANFFDNEAFNQACNELGLSEAAAESIRPHCQASAKRRIMEQAKKEPELSGYREVGEVCKIKYAEAKSSKFNYKRMAFSAFSQETERKLRG